MKDLCNDCNNDGFHYAEVGGYEENHGGGIDWAGFVSCHCDKARGLPDELDQDVVHAYYEAKEKGNTVPIIEFYLKYLLTKTLTILIVKQMDTNENSKTILKKLIKQASSIGVNVTKEHIEQLERELIDIPF